MVRNESRYSFFLVCAGKGRKDPWDKRMNLRRRIYQDGIFPLRRRACVLDYVIADCEVLDLLMFMKAEDRRHIPPPRGFGEKCWDIC